MNQTIAKILGVVLVAGALVGAYEIGRNSVSSETDETTNASPDRYGDDHYGVDLETDRHRETNGKTDSHLSPLETLTTDPSLPHVRLLDPSTGQGVRSLVVVGAPGIWPPNTRTSGARGGLYLPDTDVETLKGRAMNHYELMARSSSQSLAYWGELDFDQPNSPDAWPKKRVHMEPASPVSVRVTGPDGEPVSGAKVKLSRQRIGFVSLSKRAGPEGGARFRAIPRGTYVVSAHVGGTGRNHTDFTHEPPSTSTLTLRLRQRPTRDVPGETETTDSAPEPQRTDPRPVSVRIDGLTAGEWHESTLHWREAGGEWQLGDLERGREAGVRQWRQRLRPGTYELRVLHDGGGRASRTFEVGTEESPFEWSVDLQRKIQLYVQDSAGGPVEGALVQIWQGDALVDSMMSQGMDPVSLSLDANSTVRVVAIDARHGEAVRSVRPSSAGREVIVSLDDPLLSVDRPPGRVRQPKRIEKILEVPLVRDNASYLLDVRDPDSRAAEAGLERADRLMSLHQIGPNRWKAIVERDGQIVESQVH